MDPLLGRLVTFYKRGGKTLLVGGRPGTGKTTLALQLSQALNPKTVTVISTRMSEELLLKQYPWIKEYAPRIRIFDFRLSSAEVLVEKFIEGARAEDGLLVVDSLDTMLHVIADSEARKVENTLTAIAASQSDTRTILTSELIAGFEASSTPLEFAVDGIVELEMHVRDGRIFRKALLRKLRGSVIDRAEFPFTLSGAKIRSFDAYREPRLKPLAESIEKKSSSALGRGRSKASMDKAFDFFEKGSICPFEKGSICLIEFEPIVPLTAVMSFILPVLSRFVNEGGSAYLLPPQQLGPAELSQIIPELVTTEGLAERLRVWVDVPGFSEPYFWTFTPQSPESDFSNADRVRSELRERSAAGGVFVVRSLDRVEGMFPNKLGEVKGELLRSIGAGTAMGDVNVIISSSTAGLLGSISAMSSRHIKFEAQSGSVVVYGVKPWTRSYLVRSASSVTLFPHLFVIE
ncbi:hypothetical protein B9Q08_00380 [Candidatus Marsarchaeota G2 archaeon ECH_B_SAG-M15]|uniref:AAA+ ATPase domain-containing protein n=1 Tax=Candidatus Marsarchaeota G2 archaeon ECH_B_SAG-M15 TaxID=1978162 RepID=A0A2R6B2L3_9ARCH|nr:MAG: hypothetical protein B9Q08_00380 [Candidatus Marsarchaeota G2 archaeon ECH_B_SAG-M15]